MLSLSLIFVAEQAAGAEGKSIFRSRCAACHTLGGGKMVGPDLKGVHERRSSGWMSSFIKSSTDMIKSNDPDAVAIFNEYNQVMMPDHTDLSDEDISSLLAYMKESSAELIENPESTTSRAVAPARVDIRRPKEVNSLSIQDPAFKMTYWFIAAILVATVFALGGLVARLAK